MPYGSSLQMNVKEGQILFKEAIDIIFNWHYYIRMHAMHALVLKLCMF